MPKFRLKQRKVLLFSFRFLGSGKRGQQLSASHSHNFLVQHNFCAKPHKLLVNTTTWPIMHGHAHAVNAATLKARVDLPNIKRPVLHVDDKFFWSVDITLTPFLRLIFCQCKTCHFRKLTKMFVKSEYRPTVAPQNRG